MIIHVINMIHRVFKFRKKFKLSRVKYDNLETADWGIQALSRGKFLEKHKILVQQYLVKKFKNTSCVFFINYNVTFIKTKKPLDSRMGGGKSSIDSYGCVVTPGFIILKIRNVGFRTAYLIFENIKNKLPCKIRLIKINEQKDRNYIKNV